MFKSLLGLASDVATIATTPIRIAADVTRAVTKPLADAAKETADAVEEATSPDEKNRS